jgi:hypothetical protein
MLIIRILEADPGNKKGVTKNVFVMKVGTLLRYSGIWICGLGGPSAPSCIYEFI